MYCSCVVVLAVDLVRCWLVRRLLLRLSPPLLMVFSREPRQKTQLASGDSRRSHGLGLVPYLSIPVAYGWRAGTPHYAGSRYPCYQRSPSQTQLQMASAVRR